MKIRYYILLTIICMLIMSACGTKNGIENSGISFNDMEKTGSEEIKYAEQFSVDYYGDYTLLKIKDDSDYLIVPEGYAVPKNVPNNTVVLQQPFDNTYLVSTSVMDLLVTIDALDNVRLSGTKPEDWYIDEAKKAMDSGDILYAGKYSAPDYELIISEGCNLAIENTMIYHNPEAKEKLEELGIPVLVEKSSYEVHPLGRLEWIKVYGILYGKLDASRNYYDSQLNIIDEILGDNVSQDNPTVAFFSVTTNGSVTVRKPNDYIVKMIEMAGGQYALKDYIVEEENSLSTINIQMEDFYVAACDADILIYNSTIEGEITSIDDIIAKNSLFADFKAVKNGMVYCTGKNFFQESTGIAEFVADLYGLITNTDSDFTYIRKCRMPSEF